MRTTNLTIGFAAGLAAVALFAGGLAAGGLFDAKAPKPAAPPGPSEPRAVSLPGSAPATEAPAPLGVSDRTIRGELAAKRGKRARREPKRRGAAGDAPAGPRTPKAPKARGSQAAPVRENTAQPRRRAPARQPSERSPKRRRGAEQRPRTVAPAPVPVPVVPAPQPQPAPVPVVPAQEETGDDDVRGRRWTRWWGRDRDDDRGGRRRYRDRRGGRDRHHSRDRGRR